MSKSKRTKTQKTPPAVKLPETIELKMSPKVAVALVQAGAAWYGASFAPTVEALMRQIQQQVSCLSQADQK
jgi:hypothetical protein